MAGARQRAGKTLTRPRKTIRKTTGLLGGSFNPAHGGHRDISLFACDALDLDELWWLVSPGNPLKDKARDMAPLKARLASAQKMSRRSRIKATAIERELGTRYTINTLRALKKRHPGRQFIWIMGADNLAIFHKWRAWRDIAREMPIAVIARPGYNESAVLAPAMAWLRPYMRRARNASQWPCWPLPAITILRFRADPRSATAIRRANPTWHEQYANTHVRDDITRTRL